MDHLKELIYDPDQAVDHVQQTLAERHLRHFIKYMWAELEPAIDYVEAKSTAAMCEALEAVHHGQIMKLVINVPPGTMKTFVTNICFPAWEWGPRNMPFHRYICATYGQSLTTNISLKSRFLMRSRKYKKAWGDRFKFMAEQDNKLQFANNHLGMRLSTSVDGRLTGERATRIICDDLHNVKKGESEVDRHNVINFFFEALPTRVVDPRKFVCVVIMQRVHENDVTGEILARELNYEHLRLPMRYEEDTPCYMSVPMNYMGKANPPRECVYYTKRHLWLPWEDYEKIKDPMDPPTEVLQRKTMYRADWRTKDGELLSPDYFNVEAVERLELDMGGPDSYAVAGQLQQRPVARGGGMFPTRWTVVDQRPETIATVCGWDLACSTRRDSPYTARVKISFTKDRRILIEHALRFRAEPQEVYYKVEGLCRAEGDSMLNDFPQDPGQSGKAQVPQIAALLHGLRFTFSPESGDKETRAVPLSSQVNAGNVMLLRGEWNSMFIDEASKFPRSKYKDLVDAASRAYNRLLKLVAQDNLYGYALPNEKAASDVYDVYFH